MYSREEVLEIAKSVGYHTAAILLGYFIVVITLFILKLIHKLRVQVFNYGLKIKASRERAVFITGATSGIGLALAKFFYKRKFTVIVGYYSAQEPGYDELVQLSHGDDRLFFVELDVTSTESIKSSYESVKKYLETQGVKLHALINNAGILVHNPVVWEPHNNIKRIVDTNFTGPIMMVRQFAPLLIKAPGSRVVNICSVIAYFPIAMTTIYGATKSGLAHLTAALAGELETHDVRAVAIFPGNAIKNTSIVTRIRHNPMQVYDSLSSEEREIYADDFDRHKKFVSDFETEIIDYQQRCKDKSAQSGGLFRWLVGRMKAILMIPTGSIRSNLNLEDSSYMDSFESAVYLKRPPGVMLAGNRYFCLVVGTILESLSQSTLLRVSKFVSRLASNRSRNMKRQ